MKTGISIVTAILRGVRLQRVRTFSRHTRTEDLSAVLLRMYLSSRPAQAKKAALKTLDVVALFVEKTFFVAIPVGISKSRLASQRIAQTLRPEGKPGWRLLELLKKDADLYS